MATARTLELASTVSTGNLARTILGRALTALSDAYSLTDNQTGQVQAAGAAYLDGIRIRAEADFAALPATDDPLPTSTANQIGFDLASIETATGVLTDVSSISAFSDAISGIGDAVKSVGAGFSAGEKWLFALVVAATIFVFVVKVKK